jgi:DNA mismatch endonuclease, patch repair protein
MSSSTVRTDVMNPEQRSRCMSRIKNKNTKPEISLRKILWRMGLRYRLNSKLPGKPDIVFNKQKLAIFVDGYFWHGCPEHGTSPKTNERFWAEKLSTNIKRDRKVDRELENMGWFVIRIWEHEINSDVYSSASKISGLLDNYNNI